jgi:hypothetical protein
MRRSEQRPAEQRPASSCGGLDQQWRPRVAFPSRPLGPLAPVAGGDQRRMDPWSSRAAAQAPPGVEPGGRPGSVAGPAAGGMGVLFPAVDAPAIALARSEASGDAMKQASSDLFMPPTHQRLPTRPDLREDGSVPSLFGRAHTGAAECVHGANQMVIPFPRPAPGHHWH